MKKVVLLITVLFVSVISTACINNLAVQELNSKAKEYMQAGDAEKAICRLRSSIDLDTNIFETHYNLGVALIQNKDYSEAQKSLENAINLKPDFADSYYSLAVSLQEQGYALANPKSDDDKNTETLKNVDDDSYETSAEPESESVVKPESKTLSEQDKAEISEKFNAAIDNYNKYLSKKPDAKDKAKVASEIESLTNEIKKYNSSSAAEEE